MGLLLFQGTLGYKDGEVAVFYAHFLDLLVKEILDLLPDGEWPGTQDVAATNVVVLNQLWLCDYLVHTRKKRLQQTLATNTGHKLSSIIKYQTKIGTKQTNKTNNFQLQLEVSKKESCYSLIMKCLTAVTVS